MQLDIRNVLPLYFEENKNQNSDVWGKKLVFNKGEFIKIIAPSGSGKTSFIHFIYGIRKDFSGDIFFTGKNISNYTPEEFAACRKDNMSIIFQDMRLFSKQTVWENLEIKRQLNPYHPTEKITEMAKRLGIEDKLHSKCETCSYGEQQRVSIIRSLMQPFDFLLMDEPFSHLDDANSQKAMELIIEESRSREAAIIFANLKRVDYFSFTRLLHL
ncbi:MAG: ATP-binding cassette domain-containing protein [Bacteroidetes bacterium]|nr:ATP-binding cassette domain-containing protein [Bacteroidota bacterium]MBS1931258.1 ATP-binding cassette domain-containing protein [Bacteroidota bacterium]